MLKITPYDPFARDFFSQAGEIRIEAANLFGVVAALDAIAPGFAEVAELRVAFAVDGTVWQDWTAPLPADAEIVLFPRVAGGDHLRAA